MENREDQRTENLIVLTWLLLAAGVLCFFLADGWMDMLLHVHRNGSPIGYISYSANEVRMRPRSTLSWLDIHRHSGVFSGDTVYVGANSSVTLHLADGMMLELGANSLAQISFGSRDTIDVKLAEGTVQVDAPRTTTKSLRLETGRDEKIFRGPELNHLIASNSKSQALKVVEAVPSRVPSRTIAMIAKPSVKSPLNEDDLLSDFNLGMAKAPPPEPAPKLFVGPPAPKLFVGPPTPPPKVLAAARAPKPPQMLDFGKINVKENDAIDYTETPDQDPEATLNWKALPKVKAWEVQAKDTDTGEVQTMKISDPELVVTGKDPGHFEYVVRGLDSEEKPVTKDSQVVKLNVRPPLQTPIVESPINNALVVTDDENRLDFVTLRWQSVDSDQYELEIADNAKFRGSQTVKLKSPRYVMKLDKPLPKVYWRVRALRNRDASAWSSASFQMHNAQ